MTIWQFIDTFLKNSLNETASNDVWKAAKDFFLIFISLVSVQLSSDQNQNSVTVKNDLFNFISL